MPLQFTAHREKQRQLAISINAPAHPSPGRTVRSLVEILQPDRSSHLLIQLLGQRMQLNQVRHHAHHILWKQPRHPGDDTRKFGVACSKVLRAVQLLKKEPDCPCVSRVGEQRSVVAGEAGVLEPFDGPDAGKQVWIGLARKTTFPHATEPLDDGCRPLRHFASVQRCD